jgi:S-adenosylhomocysteine hydrolase
MVQYFKHHIEIVTGKGWVGQGVAQRFPGFDPEN